MIMARSTWSTTTPTPSEDEVREGIEGNLCRCTGYQNIVRAVQQAAADDEAGRRQAAAHRDPGRWQRS